MKKKFLRALAIAAIAMFACYNVYQSYLETERMSELALENVEALASGEGSGLACKWDYIPDSYGVARWICHEKGTGYSCSCGSVKY